MAYCNDYCYNDHVRELTDLLVEMLAFDPLLVLPDRRIDVHVLGKSHRELGYLQITEMENSIYRNELISFRSSYI